MFAEGAVLPSRFDPLAWHIHEMLFGFAMAAIAGFLLTAIPNWTGRPPVAGTGLALLGGLWVLGRVACLFSALLPAWCAIVVDLAFPVVLAGVVAREIVAGRNWRNLPMIAPLIVLGAASLLMHLEAAGLSVPAGLGWRLGLAAVLVLISVVAGRIVPSFTRNWLAKRGATALPAAAGGIDRAALGVLHAGLFAWVALPDAAPVGFLLLAGAVFNLWRLLRWRGERHDRGAAAADPARRLCLARARQRASGTVDARRRRSAKRRDPCADRRGDRHDDPGGDDPGDARPYRARAVGRQCHQPDLRSRHVSRRSRGSPPQSGRTG